MTDFDKPKHNQQSTEPIAYEVPSWSTWTRRLVTIILLISAVYALTFISSVGSILTMSLIIVFILFPAARTLTRRLRLPYRLSVVIIYLIFALILVISIFSFIPTVITWAVDFTNSTLYVYNELEDYWEDYDYEDGIVDVANVQVDFNFLFEPLQNIMLGKSILPEGQEDLPSNIIRAEEIDIQAIVNQALTIVGTLTGAVSNIANLLFQLFFISLLSFLILLELPKFYTGFFSSIPKAYSREGNLLTLQIFKVWNGFFRGEAIIAIIIGVLTWLQLELMGIPGASVLGIFTGAVSLIPTLGGIIALAPLSTVPLLQGSTVMPDANPLVLMFTVVIVNLIMQQIIWNILAPKIIGDAVSVPLPFIIVGLFVGASVGGILGAFLISPILGTLKVILMYTLHKLADEDPYPQQPNPRFNEKGLFDPKVRLVP